MSEYDDYSDKRRETNNEKDTRPIGDRVREFLESPLNDPDRKQIQLNILEDFFYSLSEALPKVMEQSFSNIFNKASKIENEEDRNFIILEDITRVNPRTGAPAYTSISALGIPISTEFTEFSWSDIRELPGYIKLHEAARDCNIAINVSNLVEKGPEGMPLPPRLTLYASQTYDQGAMAYSQSYPQLPEKEEPKIRKLNNPGKGSFDFKP